MQEITVYNSQLQSRAAPTFSGVSSSTPTESQPQQRDILLACASLRTGSPPPERADILAYKEYLNGAAFDAAKAILESL